MSNTTENMDEILEETPQGTTAQAEGPAEDTTAAEEAAQLILDDMKKSESCAVILEK